MRGWLVALLVLAAPGAARAWPADVYVDLKVGEERFEKVSALGFVHSQDPDVLAAEVLPSGELFLHGKAKGRALLLLYSEGRFAVWRVRVGTPRVEAGEALTAAKKACGPGLKVGEGALSGTVPNDACRVSLRTALEADGFKAGDLELVFELEAFQAQLRDIRKGLDARGLQKVAARYQGAGLLLEGEVTREERQKALWTVFERSLGRVPLEDRLQMKEAKEEDAP